MKNCVYSVLVYFAHLVFALYFQRQTTQTIAAAMQPSGDFITQPYEVKAGQTHYNSSQIE